jgi:hypothetical protein
MNVLICLGSKKTFSGPTTTSGLVCSIDVKNWEMQTNLAQVQ